MGEYDIIRLRLTRSISIIIPAYNEEKRLPATLAQIREWLERDRWEFAEILVVDDGSRDGTVAVAEACSGVAGVPVRVLRNPGNCGKGHSVRRGMLEAKGEWALFTDADLSAPIADLEKLWSAAERQSAEVAFGSRAVDRSLVGVHQSFLREVSGRLFNLAMRAVTGLPYRDTQCGFKLFRTTAAREIFGRQRLERFGFDVETLFIARKLGYRALEVPVRWNNVEGTKVSLWNGLAAFLDPVRVRWYSLTGKYR